MTKRMIIMLLLVGAVFGGVIWFQAFKARMMAQFLQGNAMPPATVTAMQASESAWQQQWKAIATLRAVRQVTLSSEVAGTVTAVHFHSGQQVHQGDLLLELDDATEQAQLAALRASAELARTTLKRDEQQLRIHAIAQAQLDADKADLEVKLAQVKQQRELIALRRIHAPFDGRISIRQIHKGHYLRPGDAIATLVDSHQLYADFTLPQHTLPTLKVDQPVSLTVNAWPQRRFHGRITAIQPQVNSSNRSILAEALLDNADGALMPGMFAQAQVIYGKARSFLTLPQTSLTFSAYGTTVFVARKHEEEGKTIWKAEQVFVKTGARRGDQVAILDGISAGDMIVTSGQMKLKNGTPLIIDNSHAPSNDPAPVPQDH